MKEMCESQGCDFLNANVVDLIDGMNQQNMDYVMPKEETDRPKNFCLSLST